MLTNPGFEQDWSDGGTHQALVIPASLDPYFTELGNVFSPPGWSTWYRHEGEFAQPEVRESFSINPDRMRSGLKGLLLFTFYRKHDAGFYQRVFVTPGQTYRLSAYAHAWSNHQDPARPDKFPHPDDPYWSEGAAYNPYFAKVGDTEDDDLRNFTFQVGIDPTGGIHPLLPRVVWGEGAHIYNTFYRVPSVAVTAETDIITVFLRSSTLWPFKHNDAYWDDVELELVAAQRGAPRVQYARTYVLLPPNSSLDLWYQAVDEFAGLDHTIGKSADDAGVGDLDQRVVKAVNPEEWGAGEDGTGLAGFFAKYYPGVDFQTVSLGGGGTEPPPVELPEGERLSIHLQTEVVGWLALIKAMARRAITPNAYKAQLAEAVAVTTGYVSTVKPTWVKLVGNFELADDIKRASPDTRVLIRQHISNQEPYYSGDPVAGAKAYIDTFWDAVIANPDIDGVSSLNEEVPTNNLSKLMQIIAFDLAFSDEVARRSKALGRHIVAVLLEIAVGNPEHSEMKHLVPIAEKCLEHDHAIGYHAYFPCHPDYAEEWFEKWGYHYHFRTRSMQSEFDKHGLRPRYLYTEAGAVAGEPTADGRVGVLNAGAGWRHPTCLVGNLDRYINLLLRLRDEDDLAEVATIFTTGMDYIGWKWFLFNGPELSRLSSALA